MRNRPGREVRQATTLATLVLSNRESAEALAREILKEQAERQRRIDAEKARNANK